MNTAFSLPSGPMVVVAAMLGAGTGTGAWLVLSGLLHSHPGPHLDAHPSGTGHAALNGAAEHEARESGWRGRWSAGASAAPAAPAVPGAVWWLLRPAAALLAAVLVAALTRWPVAALAAAGATWLAPGMLSGPGSGHARARQAAQLEALATWTESLAATLGAAAGLEQAIVATTRTPPEALAGPLTGLGAAVQAGAALPDALIAFSHDLDTLGQPGLEFRTGFGARYSTGSGGWRRATSEGEAGAGLGPGGSSGTVVAALMLAATRGGSSLREPLAQLAQATRDEVTARQQVETGRAQIATDTRLVAALAAVVIAALVVFNRGFLTPYDSPAGQMVMAVVIGMAVGAFAWMRRLATARDAPRVVTLDGRHDLRTERRGERHGGRRRGRPGVRAGSGVVSGPGLTGIAVLCGAGAGLGLTLVVFGLRPARPALAELLQRLHTPARPAPTRSDRVRLLLAAPSQKAGLPGPRVRADLAAAGSDPVHYLAGQAAATLVAALAVPLLGLVVLGWSPASPKTPAWAALAGAGLGWWWSRASLHADAETERGLIRHALSVMLTLMSISLARGAGIEQALDEATAVCGGRGASRLTATIRTARLLRRPPWEALAEFGKAAAIADLSDLATAMTLAGTDGARIRSALTARAAAMRTAATSQAHTDAEHATSRMTLPLLLLAGSYLVFLLFPALASLQLGSFQ